MYSKIEQGRHVKKAATLEGTDGAKTRPKVKKVKESRVQQLNVEVRSN